MRVRFVGKSDEFCCINGRVYDMIGETHGYWRIVDESGEDYLYSPEVFEVVDKEDGKNEE